MESYQDETQKIHQDLTKQADSEVKGTNDIEIKQSEIPSGHHTEIQEAISQYKSFEPFVANALQWIAQNGILPYAAVYSEKHNLIFACCRDKSMLFYDATTLSPFEGIEPETVDGIALGVSFWPETENFIIGCVKGHIYISNLHRKTLQRIQCVRDHIMSVAFLNSNNYVFAEKDSNQLTVGNLEDGNLLRFSLQGSNARFLYNFTKRNLLLSILIDGSVRIFRTGKLPRLPLLASIPKYESQDYQVFRKIQAVTIKRKEYIITTGSDSQIKIWHFYKGIMKLLKVIQAEEQVVDLVYLENYQILVSTHQTEYTRFWSFPCGRLEAALDLEMIRCHTIWMKDKNCLVIANAFNNKIKILKLHP